MSREKVLLAGATSTAKTMNLIQLCLLYPEAKVVIFDPEDGVEKVAQEIGFDAYWKFQPEDTELELTRDNLTSLTIVPITPDWDSLVTRYKMLKAVLLSQDWVCPDMLGTMWDFAQNHYSRSVFGVSPSQHLMTLRNQAKATNFGGFDGLTDWTIIKRMHNEEFRDDMCLWSVYNVMGTTSISSFLPVEKLPKSGIEGILANKFNLKLDGEKNNGYRFDTILILAKKPDGRFFFRIAKDKGRAFDLDMEYEFTGGSVWQKYSEVHGVAL
jgi:hypothetical protein